jgi:hypothetical protein
VDDPDDKLPDEEGIDDNPPEGGRLDNSPAKEGPDINPFDDDGSDGYWSENEHKTVDSRCGHISVIQIRSV